MIPTPEKRAEFTAGLRKMADYIDGLPPAIPLDCNLHHLSYFYESIPHPDTGEMFSGNTPEGMALLISLLGSIEKDADSNYFRANKRFGPGVMLGWFADRNSVCHAKVVGTRLVPARAERVIAAEPERVEEVVEWDCPSFLALRRPTTIDVPQEAALPSPDLPRLGDGHHWGGNPHAAPDPQEQEDDLPF
jgi:hypothetical protein